MVTMSQKLSLTQIPQAVPWVLTPDNAALSKNTYIATLVERHTRYVMLMKVPSKDTETVVNALIKHARILPTELCKSLTWDRIALNPIPSQLAERNRQTI